MANLSLNMHSCYYEKDCMIFFWGGGFGGCGWVGGLVKESVLGDKFMMEGLRLQQLWL